MPKFSSYAIAEPVLQEATNQFSGMVIDDILLEGVKKRCELIDYILQENNGDYFEIDVDDVTLKITLSFCVPEVIYETRTDRRIVRLMMSSEKTIIKIEDGDKIRTDLVFPGIWKYEN